MKKMIPVMLALALLFSVSFAVSAEEESPAPGEVIEEYVNVITSDVCLSISSAGTATVKINCYGYSGTTHISSTTYLEKWTGTGWSRVSFNGMSQIDDGVSASSLDKTYTTTVGSGTYRATASFTVTRGGVNETVTVNSSNVTH